MTKRRHSIQCLYRPFNVLKYMPPIISDSRKHNSLKMASCELSVLFRFIMFDHLRLWSKYWCTFKNCLFRNTKRRLHRMHICNWIGIVWQWYGSTSYEWFINTISKQCPFWIYVYPLNLLNERKLWCLSVPYGICAILIDKTVTTP